MRGARIVEHTRSTSITVDGRRCTTVHTARAATRIECEIVVNAAGMWGMEIGRMAGARVPAVAVEHQYVLTGPIDGYTPVELGRCRRCATRITSCTTSPTDPGCWSAATSPTRSPFGVDGGIPSPFQRQLFDPNFDRFEQLAELAAKRTPVIEQAGIRTLINGPIPYSADADFVMGRAPELDNFFVATGLPVRHRRRRRGRQDDGRVDPRGPTRRSTCGRSTCAASRSTTPRATSWTRGWSSSTATTTSSPHPGPST